MSGVVPVISKLPPASPKETKGYVVAVPARKAELIGWFLRGQEVLRTIETLATSPLSSQPLPPSSPAQALLRDLTKVELSNLLFVQGLFDVAEYPSNWARDLAISLGTAKDITGTAVYARAARLAHYLNPGWNPATLVHEIKRLRKEVSGKGDFPELSTYSYGAWCSRLEVAQRAIANAERAARPQPPGVGGEVAGGIGGKTVADAAGGARGDVAPLVLDRASKERIEESLRFIERLAQWQQAAPFEGQVDRPVVFLGLIVRALQEIKPGRGEWSALVAQAGLTEPTIRKHLASLFPLDAAERRAEQLAVLRASIGEMPRSGKLSLLRSAATRVMALRGVAWSGGREGAAAAIVRTRRVEGVRAAAAEQRIVKAPVEAPLGNGTPIADSGTAASQQRIPASTQTVALAAPKVLAPAPGLPKNPSLEQRIDHSLGILAALDQFRQGAQFAPPGPSKEELQAALVLRALQEVPAGWGELGNIIQRTGLDRPVIWERVWSFSPQAPREKDLTLLQRLRDRLKGKATIGAALQLRSAAERYLKTRKDTRGGALLAGISLSAHSGAAAPGGARNTQVLQRERDPGAPPTVVSVPVLEPQAVSPARAEQAAPRAATASTVDLHTPRVLDIDPALQSRVDSALAFMAKLGRWQPGTPFEGTIGSEEKEKSVQGLILRALQDIPPGRGELGELSALLGLSRMTVWRYLNLFPGKPAADNDRKLLTALRACLAQRERIEDLDRLKRATVALIGGHTTRHIRLAQADGAVSAESSGKFAPTKDRPGSESTMIATTSPALPVEIPEQVRKQLDAAMDLAARLARPQESTPGAAASTVCRADVQLAQLLCGLSGAGNVGKGVFARLGKSSALRPTEVSAVLNQLRGPLGAHTVRDVIPVLQSYVAEHAPGQDQSHLDPQVIAENAAPFLRAAAIAARAIARRMSSARAGMLDPGESAHGGGPREYDGWQLYKRDALGGALLTPTEERELAVRNRSGDEEARELLIRANLRLVVKIAHEFDGLLPMADMISEGNIGLMKAVERYDPDKGAKLSTYAAWWIKQAIRRAVTEQAKTVRMPVHVYEKLRKLHNAEKDLLAELGRAPSDGEVAAHLDWEVEKVEKIRKSEVKAITSLDEPLGNEGDVNRHTLMEDSHAPDAAVNTARAEMHDLVRELLSDNDTRAGLTAREKWILHERFFSENNDSLASGRTLVEVGNEVGLTRERIRQLQVKALRKLGGALRSLEKVREAQDL